MGLEQCVHAGRSFRIVENWRCVLALRQRQSMELTAAGIVLSSSPEHKKGPTHRLLCSTQEGFSVVGDMEMSETAELLQGRRLSALGKTEDLFGEAFARYQRPPGEAGKAGGSAEERGTHRPVPERPEPGANRASGKSEHRQGTYEAG
ncbi:MAG TPA: hypothetical protein GX507_08775 [Clostridia bacterium]|nr:hypothetical protein [Clostridia bacterium]